MDPAEDRSPTGSKSSHENKTAERGPGYRSMGTLTMLPHSVHEPS